MRDTWSVNVAVLSHSRDGTFIRIENRPLWAIALEEFGDNVLPKLTGEIFCCKMPGWTDKIHWGPADEHGYVEKSLMAYMYRFGQWSLGGFGAWRHSKHIASIPVTYEWVKENYPDAGWPFNGEDE